MNYGEEFVFVKRKQEESIKPAEGLPTEGAGPSEFLDHGDLVAIIEVGTIDTVLPNL
jgi:hypothetical protein